jgi:thiol-disulfide isomerase/thioredoxin
MPARFACFRFAGLLSAGWFLACGPKTAASEIDLTGAAQGDVVEPARSIDSEHPIPAFRVHTIAGDVFDSEAFIGKRAFMLVYFATWCQVCRMKLPMVRFVLDRYAADLEVFGVVMDDQSTWHDVPTYLERYDIDYELIRAEQFPRFAAAFSPSGLVPAVTVVDKNGYVLEYQHGYSRSHLASLIHAVTVAEKSR